jgi:predicted GTPase
MPSKRGKSLRVKYITQTGVNIPTFVCFVNDETLVTTDFERFMTNLIRERYHFWGTPIRLMFRGSGKTSEELRRERKEKKEVASRIVKPTRARDLKK